MKPNAEYFLLICHKYGIKRLSRQSSLGCFGGIVQSVYQIHINKTGGTTVAKALGLEFHHRDINDILSEIDEAEFYSAFIFTFVRNPWDRAVSHYHWRVKTNQTRLGDRDLTFEDWVQASFKDKDPVFFDKPKMFRQQIDWLRTHENEGVHPGVDFIGRFETLSSDIEKLNGLLSGPEIRAMPHLKSSRRQLPYTTYYDEKSYEIISSVFATDIKTFGYEFGI